MKRVLLTPALLVLVSTGSARAASVTIDSSNCNSSGGCYGLEWMLTVNELATPTIYNGVTYEYEAILKVMDDPDVTGDPSVVISAVDFQASNSVTAAALYTYPSAISSDWDTSINGLTGNGCVGSSNPGFVCSQTATDPANFVAPTTLAAAITWGWYFNADTIFTDLIGAHIGAKMTDLSTKGKLLSASYTVPEPTSLALLATGLAAAAIARGRRRKSTRL